MGLSRPIEVVAFDISRLTLEAVKPFGLEQFAKRCAARTCGRSVWRFGCSIATARPLIEWLKTKFGAKSETLVEANIAALNAGHAYGETAEIGGPLKQLGVAPAQLPPGLYRTVTGGEAVALGLVAGSQLAGLPMFLGSYPITPASADPAPSGES